MLGQSGIAPSVIIAEAVTFDPGVVIAALVVLAVLAITAIVWTIVLIRFGFQLGRAVGDRRRLVKWAAMSLPPVLIVLDRINSGDRRDFGWYLALLGVVVVPPLVGGAVQQFHPGEPSEIQPGTQPDKDDT